jgi:hypothetical protein
MNAVAAGTTMPPTTNRSLRSFLRAAMGILVAATLSGCVGSGPGVSGSSSHAVSSAPSAPASAAGFYLRAWQTQAFAPQYTFAWLAPVTIANGQFIDGNVAVPAIYPGPIYVGPQSRPISDAGVAAIVAEARKDGLLGDKTDFSTSAAPGSVLTHIQLQIDGVTRELSGPLSKGQVPDPAAPATPAAYQSFWNQIMSINAWLAADLGQGNSFTPTSLAVLVTPPTAATAGIAATDKAWPLATTFATFGKSFGGSAYRCATVTGADAATLLAVVVDSNQLTHFSDSTGAKASLQVRAMLPGELDPCL